MSEVFNLPVPTSLQQVRIEDQFEAWVAMGEGRSLRAVSEKIGEKVAAVVRHAETFKWRERLVAISHEASALTMKSMGETVSTINQKHLEELRALRQKAIDFLSKYPLEKHSDAIKLYLASLERERSVLGLDEKTSDRDLADLLVERMKEITIDNQGSGPEFELDPGVALEPLDEDG